MRTGPFSDTKIINTLNASYVPVFAVNEDYRDNGSAAPAERAEYQRICREALNKNFSAGTVHVYLTDPDGNTIAGMHVAEAAQTPKLQALLEQMAKKVNAPEGRPVVAPKPQSCPPSSGKGSLALHLTARPLSGGGSWDGISEDWVVYTPAEQKRFLPANALKTGAKWSVDTELIHRLLVHFYPVTENNDTTKNRVIAQDATAQIVSVRNGIARAKVYGTLLMTHWFYHKDDGKMVNAPFHGYMDIELSTKRIRKFRLATDKASYGGGEFGIAVQSKP